MRKWVTSLVLILALAGGVFAGVPLQFGGHDCNDMECCAAEQASTPSHAAHESVPAAEQSGELYCFLNCPQPALPGQGATVKQVSTFISPGHHPAAVQRPLVVPVASLRQSAPEPSRQESKPIYIRHLALLI